MTPRRRALPGLAVLVLGACLPPAGGPATAPAPTPTTTSAPAATPATTPAPVPPVVAAPPDPDLVAPDAAAESLLVDVARVDSTIRVELRYATPYNFMGEALPGYEAPRALLRREAAAALARVQARLRAEGAETGLALKVFDAYRPVRATDAMVAWTRRVRREDLVRDGYVAERSQHNQGLAVDVTLVELATGRELRMGTAFDTFAPAARTANATGEFAANRQRLKRAMEAEGFTNAAHEWWHYSYAVPDPMRFDLVIR